MSTRWRSWIWIEEIQNTHWLSHSVSLNLKDDSYRKPIRASSAWENTFVKQIGDEEPSSSRKLRKKLPRNCRIEKTLLQRRKRSNSTKDEWIFFAAWSKITNSESITGSTSEITRTIGIYWRIEHLLWSWLIEQLWRTSVPHQALINSGSRKRSREVGMPRNTRENLSIPGNVFDRQHAQRDFDELHNDSIILATSLAILRTEGIEKSGSEEPLQPKHLPCFFAESKRKSLNDRNCLMSMTNHALGTWTCTQVAWQFWVILPRGYIWENFLTIRNFRAELWISEQKFTQRRRIPHALCSGTRKSEQPAR